MKASHILIPHLHEAQDLQRALKSGKSFESLARKFSQCPSAEIGGWLGEINQRSIDPIFWSALNKLQSNEISEPIRTRFGHHLIRREQDDSEDGVY